MIGSVGDTLRDVVATPEVSEEAPGGVERISLGGGKTKAPGSCAFTEEGDDAEATSSEILVDGGSA